MPFVTDFDVTYGNALAPAGFHRVTTREGGSADLNTLAAATSQSFLWTHDGASRGNPVVELGVTYDDESGPKGFERVSRDLVKGGAGERKAYLWLRRQAQQPPSRTLEPQKHGSSHNPEERRKQPPAVPPAKETVMVKSEVAGGNKPPSEKNSETTAPLPLLPISEVVVGFGSSDLNAEEEAETAERKLVTSGEREEEREKEERSGNKCAPRVWERLERSLNPPTTLVGAGSGNEKQPGGVAVFLWYRRYNGSEDESLSWSSHSLAAGDWLDARDSDGNWCVAQVVKIEGEDVRVHFQGWSSRFDEDLRLESSKLAKLGTHTSGRNTGQLTRRPGDPWDVTPEQVREVTHSVKKLLPGILREEERGAGDGFGGTGGGGGGSAGGGGAGGGQKQGRGQEVSFWKIVLPSFIERCMSSTIVDLHALPFINNLLVLMLEIIALRLRQPGPMPRHLLQTLSRLGHSDRRCAWYYSNYGRSSSSASSYESPASSELWGEADLVVAERSPQWDQVYMQAPRGSIRVGFQYDASHLYVSNMNHFGRAGGYAALLSRMDPSRVAAPVPMEELVTYVGFLAAGPRCFVWNFANDYLEDVRRAVLGRLGRLSNDELGGEEEAVMALVNYLGAMMPVVQKNYNATENTERFHLMFALQLVRCPFLNPRIRGVAILSEIIDIVVRAGIRRRSRGKAGVGGNNSNANNTVGYTYSWIQEDWLVSWLENKQIVEAVLGDPNPSGGTTGQEDAAPSAAENIRSTGRGNMSDDDEANQKIHDTHVEVLKRAHGLLWFMADHGKVSNKHLDLLWAAGKGQPDAQVRVVFRLVGHICPRLGQSGLNVLYDHLRQLPSQYEAMHVEVIRHFAEAASGWGARASVSADNKKAPTPQKDVATPQSIFGQGLELLWESVQDHAPVTAEIADQASEALADLLCHPSGVGDRSDQHHHSSYNAPASSVTSSRLQTGIGYLGGGSSGAAAAAAAAAKEGDLHWKQLVFFFDMCLENVKDGKSVAPSLRLMQRIIDAQPESSTGAWGSETRGGSNIRSGGAGAGVVRRKDEILETLDRDHNLLNLLVDELLRYRRKAQAVATEAGITASLGDSIGSNASSGGGGSGAGTAGGGNPLSFKLLGARLPHGEALSIRLEFVGFVASKSKVELTFLLVEKLWRDFLWNPLCAAETEIFFAWMQSTTPLAYVHPHGGGGQGFVTMSSDVVHEVFRRLLCEEGGVDFDSLGPRGFWCLWRYFLVVNTQGKALSPLSVQKNYIVVEDFFDIQGLDTLWEAFLRSRATTVVKDAGDLLAQLHLRLKDQSDNQRVWHSFVNRCMSTFETALKSSGLERTLLSPSPLAVVNSAAGVGGGGGDGAGFEGVVAFERVMRLLVKFLDEIDRPNGLPSYGTALHYSADEVPLKVVVRTPKASNGSQQKSRELLWVMRKRSVTVGELRARISREMGHPANQVYLSNNQRHVPSPLHDGLLLEEVPITTYCEVVLLDKPTVDTTGYIAPPLGKSRSWDAGLARKVPRHALANHDGYLTTLFRLMDAGPPSLVDLTWALVQTLPVTERIQQELESMGGRLILPTQAATTTAGDRAPLSISGEETVLDQSNGNKASSSNINKKGKESIVARGRRQDKTKGRRDGSTGSSSKESVTSDSRGGGVGGGAGSGVAGEVEWTTLLDGSRVPELLYRLEVVYTLVEPAGDEFALPGDRLDATEWRRVFLMTGGMKHLLALLGRDQGIDPSQSLHKACLAALLKLAAHFTASAYNSKSSLPAKTQESSFAASKSGRGMNGVASGGEGTESRPKSAQDVVRELYVGIDLPTLVLRMLEVMHEVSKPTPENEGGLGLTGSAGDPALDVGGRSLHNSSTTVPSSIVLDQEGRHRPPPQAEVIQHTLSLLGTLTELEPGLSEVMLSSPGLGPALGFSLLHTPERLVRKEVSAGVLGMAISLRLTSKEDSVQGFLRLLLPLLPEAELYGSRCEMYFNLVGVLIAQANAIPPGEQADLCLHLADLISSRPPVEQSEEDQDLVLSGYMNFLRNALKSLPTHLKDVVKAKLGADREEKPTSKFTTTPAASVATDLPHSGASSALATLTTVSVSAVTSAAGHLVGGMWGAGKASRGKGRGGKVGEKEGRARGLVRELVERCLFSPPHERSSVLFSGNGKDGNSAWKKSGAGDDEFEGIPLPKCKSERSREVAFQLLNELASGCISNLRLTGELVGPHHYLGMTSAEGRRRAEEEQRKRKDRARGGVRLACVDGGDEVGSTTRVRTSSFGQQPHQIAKHKSKTGFVGLKNMGCICYMNSTLQQLFMVPEFREGVLAYRDSDFRSDDVDGDDNTPSEERQGRLMWQLQNMFSHLQESEKAHFNPRGLVHSLRDWEGQPLDVMVQQDASEFLTQFFQQVEGSVMGSSSENILKQSFGGVYSNELLAESGQLYSERPEPFSYISVEVKNMKTLAEALDAFTKEELVSFKWDKEINPETGERQAVTLSTQKRCSIKSLPKHLVIHLKRFDFDFDTMQQTKINDRLEFPFELNMYPYTKEGRAAVAAAAESSGGNHQQDQQQENDGGIAGRPRVSGNHEERPGEYYHYHLAGVVVHMGTANSGHYYSYIRSRDGDGEWLEFNDTVVCSFDPKDMEAECFGGEDTSQYTTQQQQQQQFAGSSSSSNNSNNNSSRWKRERTQNAFLLVYDKATTPTAPQQTTEAGQKQLSRRYYDNAAVESCSDDISPALAVSSLSPRLPPPPPTVDPARFSAGADSTSVRGTIGAASGGAVGGVSWGDIEKGGWGRRKRFRAKAPAVFMRQIHQENMEFWRKKNVLDNLNYGFINKLVAGDKPQGEEGIDKNAPLRLATCFALGTLVQARERDLMIHWAEFLRKYIPSRPDVCLWLLGELGRSPLSLRELLLAPDETVRNAATVVIIAALRRVVVAAGGGGGREGGGVEDVYLPAHAAMVLQDEEERKKGLEKRKDGFLGGASWTAGHQNHGVDRGGGGDSSGDGDGAAQEEDVIGLTQNMGLLSMWSNSTINRRRETGGASSHGASRDAGVSESDMSAAAAAAAVIVRFIRAWLDLLSVAPDINHLDWAQSGQLLSLLTAFAEAGPSERCLLLHIGSLGALMSMCLGDDSPYPELVHAPRPRRRHNLSEDEDAASPPSPRRPHRTSHFAPTVSEAMAGDEGGGRRSEEKVVAGEEIGFYGATKDLRQGRDLSALLTAMAPLVLASELAWGEVDVDVDNAKAVSDADDVNHGLSPAALRPLSRMSREEQQMLTSPAFLMRLILLLREPNQKHLLVPLVQHLCWRNKLMSKLVIINVCECIEIPRDIDASLSKPGFRAFMVILGKVQDGWEHWRLNLAMPNIMKTIEEHSNLPRVTEQAFEMLMRLAKASPGVRQWMAVHRDSLEWIEHCLAQALSVRQGRGEIITTGHYGARDDGPPTSVSGDGVCPAVWHEVTLASIGALLRGQEILPLSYDSDDDPDVLVNKRVQVKWRDDRWFSGTVTQYDPSTRRHHIYYDDTDVRWYPMDTKTWRLLPDRTFV